MGLAARLADGVAATGEFRLLSDGEGVPLVAFSLVKRDVSRGFDEFDVSDELHARGGWVVPAYPMAPKAQALTLLRAVIRDDFSAELCDALLRDLRAALEHLRAAGGREARAAGDKEEKVEVTTKGPHRHPVAKLGAGARSHPGMC